MRIQILPLPAMTLGDATQTPFVVVVDQREDPDEFTEEAAEWIKRTWGATSVIVSDGTSIEISPHLELPEDLQQALLAHLTSATTKEKP